MRPVSSFWDGFGGLASGWLLMNAQARAGEKFRSVKRLEGKDSRESRAGPGVPRRSHESFRRRREEGFSQAERGHPFPGVPPFRLAGGYFVFPLTVKWSRRFRAQQSSTASLQSGTSLPKEVVFMRFAATPRETR